MNAKQIAEILEGYEQKAYAEGFGQDWLTDVGENLKLYMINCHQKGIKPSFDSLLKWIDELYIKAMA